ncbi:hypothetical protein BFG60_4432 [Microcystis aeruginosa NIES-98]|nr:hypothetical protein BFG60_4432 [Microcystis aeruginosa NIES-98]
MVTAIIGQLSVISYQLSVISYRLPISLFSYLLTSKIHFTPWSDRD